MNRSAPSPVARLIGFCHRVVYATLITGAVWLLLVVPSDQALGKVATTLLNVADLPIATASQILPCNARGLDLWYRVDPGESACPHLATQSEAFRSHMGVGVVSYVLLFYLPNLFLFAHRRLRLRRTSAKVVAAVFSFLAVAHEALAAGRGPSTPEERDKAVAIVRALEADPLNDGARDGRAWLIAWLSEVPDIEVQMCPALLGKGFESKRKYGAELAVQQSLSSAAFIIEHPDQAKDPLAVSLAGVEGVLRTYEALLSKKPKASFPSLDALRDAKGVGALEALVVENMKACM